MANKRIFFVVTGFLCLSLISNLIFINQKGNIKAKLDQEVLKADSLLSMKLMLDGKLDQSNDLLKKYDIELNVLKVDLTARTAELEEEKVKSAKLLNEAASGRNSRKQLSDLQKSNAEMEKSLRAIHDKYNELEKIYFTLSREYELVKNENAMLTSQLEWARELRVVNIKPEYQKLRKEKVSSISKVRKANRIQVNFDVLENPVAAAGSRQVYLVITDPSGKILGTRQFTNVKYSKQQAYSSVKTIDYNNSEQRVIINYDFQTKPASGKYVIEVYIDGLQGGKKIVEFIGGKEGFSI